MIIRICRARTRPGQGGAYAEFLQRRKVPFLRSSTGCLEVRVARAVTEDGPGEFLILTVWDSLDHLRSAAGPTWDSPVVDPEESPFLEATSVDHFEES